MLTYSGPMWPDKQTKRELCDLLKHVPDNDWNWTFFECDAIGYAPRGLTMVEFEALALTHQGVSVSWQELNAFAASLMDIHHCLLVATEQGINVTNHVIDRLAPTERVAKGTGGALDTELVKVKAFIEVFDSTSWTIKVSESQCCEE